MSEQPDPGRRQPTPAGRQPAHGRRQQLTGRSGPGRRRFLGLAGAAAAGAALAACHPGGGTSPGARARAAAESPGSAPATAARTEGERAGDPDWRITLAGSDRAIEGWADRVSVLAGESFGLHVSTTAPAFTVSAYRMGWYGGARARLIWRSPQLPGADRPAGDVDPGTRTVTTRWPRTAAVDTAGWPEGCYLLRLDAQDGAGQRYVPLTVRSPSTEGRTVLVNAVATWQAYNDWGGHDLYNGPTGGYPTRSLAVSFDRPYRHDHGAGLFLVYEAPLVALAERLGLPLAYTTGIDLAREPGLLRGARAVLSPGHDEYWSPEQRAHVTAARDAGTNIAVLGANCCFRRIRLEPSPTGPHRTVVCYKASYRQDTGFAAGLPPTTDYRAAPAADPESSLLGVIYDGYPVDAPYVVGQDTHWLFEGTGAVTGDSFPHLVGVEYDRVDTGWPTPRPIEILAHSPVSCAGRASHSDTAYHTAPSGAGVFATGTMRWVEALDAAGDGTSGDDHAMDARTGAFTRRVTENLLRVFAAGPAGRTHPAADNVAAVYGAG
ncbi:N,N-dimethylformamidase beta subunit family domain-containing protein [Kitasatospora sp. NPDC050543]|uniref:N,N-dimethylformamidase beta subunit family domain-containing protein n=1 Tax=Kitasatospora sp. NPDC050543 TaxID=3364054 RepID=UPI0037AE8BAC